jgi:fumarate hydratase subunit beta
MEIHMELPITAEKADSLHAGDFVYLSGQMYVARDAAHKRLMELIEKNEQLPIDIKDCTIYYMGPSPAREGRPIGSAGPTTASRMDKYAPTLLDLGEKAMVGKGKRTKEVLDAVVRNHAVYFAAIGGAGALLSQCIRKSEIIAYEDLGAEAIRLITVEDFPVIVVADDHGNNLYSTAQQEYQIS